MWRGEVFTPVKPYYSIRNMDDFVKIESLINPANII